MATETLRLDIVADSAQAKAELQKLNNQLAIFERAVKKATDPAQIQYLNKNIEFLSGKIQVATAANQKFATGSNQAANALTNLGRVAQDAPFGFIGIQNNLNPLLESFQRLKVETGSTGGALKSLAGSLIGPAGLGLALSLGSAALLMFGDRLFKTKKEISETAKAYQEFNEVQKSANKDAAKDIINAKILYEASQNVTLSMKDRLKAATELKDLYPQLLGKYSAEKIVLGEVKTLYTDLTAEIIKNARAKAYAAKISELEAKKLDAEVQIQKIINAGNKERARTQNDAFNPQGIAAIDKGSTAAEKNAEITARGTLKIKEQAEIINKATEQQKFYENAIGKTNLQQQTVNDLTEKTTKKYKSIADILKELENNLKGVKAQYDAGALDISEERVKRFDLLKKAIGDIGKQQGPQATAAIAKLTKQIDAMFVSSAKLKTVDTTLEIASPSRNATANAVGPNDAMVQRSLAVQEATKRQLDYANALRLTTQNEEAAAAMTNVAMSAFTSLGNAMLMGQDMGEALSNVFKKLIVDLTQMVVRALIFKAIMSAFSLGATTAAGGASGGGGFLNFFKGLMGFADGGIASGPKSGYPVMLHGTEAVLNPKQFKNLTSNMMNLGAAQGGGAMNLQGEFVVRGQDLVYVLNSTNRNNGLLGR